MIILGRPNNKVCATCSTKYELILNIFLQIHILINRKCSRTYATRYILPYSTLD